MFTREQLKSLATDTSFNRGQEYFRSGSVGKIVREGDKFTAKVRGTHSYKVQLTLKPDGIRLKCSCPYDFEGVCKHAVALGLAVLQEAGPQPTSDSTPAALEAALRDTAADAQLAFLAGLLRQDAGLARQFLAHVAPAAEAAPPAAPPEATIDGLSTELYEALSDLAFDDELLSEYAEFYEDYLYDEGNGMLTLADQAIDEVLAPHADAVAAALAAGRLAEALRRWVGVYEGSAAATEPQADDYDLFSYEGYPAYVQERWLSLLAEHGTDALLESTPFAPAETEAALALLIGRYREPAIQPKVLAGHAVTLIRPYPPIQLPPHFYELLRHLATDPATAARLRPLLAEVQPPSLDLARVQLRVAEVLADDPLWLRTTEAFAKQDVNLTMQLLERYRERDDRTSLLRLLHERREQFAYQLNAYVLRHVAPAEDEALYLTALAQRCRQTQSLPDYQELRGYWTPAQRRAFVDEQVALGSRSGTDPLFGAELLAAEDRAAEILPLLLRTPWSWQRSVPEGLALALPTHPDDCLEAVMEQTENLLQDSINGRGRDKYQRIASWLTALQAAAELRPPVALFAAYLYTEYSRLAALREELRAAHLVRTQLVGKQHRLLTSEVEDEEVRALLRDKGAKSGRKGKLN